MAINAFVNGPLPNLHKTHQNAELWLNCLGYTVSLFMHTYIFIVTWYWFEVRCWQSTSRYYPVHVIQRAIWPGSASCLYHQDYTCGCQNWNIPVWHGQHHGCWWPGSLPVQVISSYVTKYAGWSSSCSQMSTRHLRYFSEIYVSRF